MPEAVSAYAENPQHKEVSRIHASIIETYREDFPKYIGSRSLARMIEVFNHAAHNIGTKVKYSQFSRSAQSNTIRSDIELLVMARLLLKVCHSDCSGLPLQAGIKPDIYKLLFLDVGLMNNLCGLDAYIIDQLGDRKLINEGKIAEQFIGQHLQHIANEKTNRDLIYWLREGKSNNSELDYVTSVGDQIIPVEVKAGASGSLKSLHQFVGQKEIPRALRFDANPPSTQIVETSIRYGNKSKPVRYELLSLPLYMVEQLPRLCGSA
jgi:predicted AAA+ superfamily ATPase